jgi:putative aldouronate transport system permease protein
MSRPFYIKQTKSGAIFDVVNHILLLLFLCLMLYPFINIIAISFNDGSDALRGGVYLWPRVFTTANYAFVLKNDTLFKGALVSVLRSVVGTTTGVFCNALLGYIVSCRKFSGRSFIRILFVFTMYFSGGLIPTYLLLTSLGFANTFTVYWLPYLCGGFYMLLAASYIQNIPETMFEAVRVDGGSEFRIFLQFVLPLSLPMLACIAIYIGVWHWNSWFDVNLYSHDGVWDNLQIILYRILNQSQSLTDTSSSVMAYQEMKSIQPLTVRSAITVIVVAPIVIIYPFFQKYFITGMTLGSVKQ